MEYTMRKSVRQKLRLLVIYVAATCWFLMSAPLAEAGVFKVRIGGITFKVWCPGLTTLEGQTPSSLETKCKRWHSWNPEPTTDRPVFNMSNGLNVENNANGSLVLLNESLDGQGILMSDEPLVGSIGDGIMMTLPSLDDGEVLSFVLSSSANLDATGDFELSRGLGEINVVADGGTVLLATTADDQPESPVAIYMGRESETTLQFGFGYEPFLIEEDPMQIGSGDEAARAFSILTTVSDPALALQPEFHFGIKWSGITRSRRKILLENARSIPEPGTMALLVACVVSNGLCRRKA